MMIYIDTSFWMGVICGAIAMAFAWWMFGDIRGASP